MANVKYGVNIIPRTNNTYTIGNSDYKWANIYTVQINGTNVSDLGSVQDVQINSTSILNNGVANIPIATTSTPGLIKASGYGSGLQLDSTGYLKLSYPGASTIKAGSNLYAPVVVGIQHESVFYGLAKAAGDSTQSASSNAVGIYTNNAKAAIKEMLGTDEWLERNDLDADITGKVNMLSTPYSMDDILQGKIIYANGTINDTSSYCISPLISISAGTYGLKTNHNEYIGNINNGNSYKNGYGFFAADGTTIVARPENLLHSLGNDIYVFEVPAEAVYVRFCYVASGPKYYEDALAFFNQWILLPDADDNIDNSFFVVQQKKPNIEVDKLLRLDGSYASLRDSQARQDVAEALGRPITFGRKTCAIFEKVCCIGDSYTAGYIYSSSGTAISNNKYSWVEHIKNATGRDYVNCGISGATTKSWLTNPEGLAKAQLPENKAQAYIVALQINDAETDLAIGTIADIGTSAETYYGCTSKIIDEIFNINNAAHIFFLTQPKHFSGIHSPYRTAELAVIDWYQTEGNGTHQNQVHLIDLLDYWQLFQYSGCVDSSANGHYTGVGWEYTAEIIMFAWSEYINAHPLLFQDVNLIPYGINLTGKVTDVQINSTSVVSNGVANIPIATNQVFGAVKTGQFGIGISNNGNLMTNRAQINDIKAGTNQYLPIVPDYQHRSTFYGLAKAAGDSTQSASSNEVGIYTDEAKIAIQKMLGIYEPPFVLLNDITLDERTSVSLTADDNNTPYNLRNVFMEIKYPADLVSESSGYDRWQFHNSNSDFLNCETGRYTTNSMNCFKRLWTERKGNLILAYYSRQINTGSYGETYFKDTIAGSRGAKFDFGNITAIKMNTSDYEPAGTQIKIWGQWAY